MHRNNLITMRLLSQQLASPQFSDPAQLVSWMGAVQAQEYRLMRWAVEMRTKSPDEQAFARAYDSGRIVRMHLMRGTWQLISGEDYPWMMSLFAGRALKVIQGWMHANGISLPEDEIARVSEILCEEALRLGSATKEDFAEALASRGIVMDDHRLSYHIRMAELNGLLCNGDLLPMKASYSLTAAKLPVLPPIGRDEALALLARKYFQSHGPATLEDFVWWSGLGVGDCRRGIGLLGQELLTEDFHDRSFYVHSACRTRGCRSGKLLLLPSYDEYLIGYKSRDIVLPPEHRARAHNNSGNFYPVIARDGVVCGNWSPFAGSHGAAFFDPQADNSGVDEAWIRYLNFKGK